MSVKLSEFATGATVEEGDHVVGYSNTNAGGERKWTLANLRTSLIKGAASTIDTEDLTANKAIISNNIGKIGVSSVTSTELAQLAGVKTNITVQAQIDAKGSGTVTSVTGSAPISVTNGTSTPAISITEATTSAAGTMSSTDKTRLDDASGVNGLVKCNGSGNFSVAGVSDIPGLPTAKELASAWVTFEGVGAITVRRSFNVSSVTDQGTGQYNINWDTNFESQHYAWFGTARDHSDSLNDHIVVGAASSSAKTTGTLRIRTSEDNGTSYETTEINIVAFV